MVDTRCDRSAVVNGTQVQLRTCQNFKDQHWSLP